MRCDDTVVTTDRLHPKYGEYQMGCGFLLWSFICDSSPAALQEELTQLFRNLTRELSKPVHVNSDCRNSLQGDEAFSLLCAGTEGIKRLYAHCTPSVSGPTPPVATPELDENIARSLVRKEWIESLSLFFHWNQFMRLTGSHYLDILRSENTEGEYFILLHACGFQFSDLMNVQTRKAMHAGILRDENLQVVMHLMKNAATARRILLAVEVLNRLSPLHKGERVSYLLDQTHHEVEAAGDGRYRYFNDSQMIVPGVPLVLPAGFANCPSHYIHTGANVKRDPEGISHNLKPVLKRDTERIRLSEKMVYAQANLRRPLTCILGGSSWYSTTTAGIEASPDARILVENLQARHGFECVNRLLPIFRFHVRRPGEKPFAKKVDFQ